MHKFDIDVTSDANMLTIELHFMKPVIAHTSFVII